jgi:hypothetical protein
MQRVEWFCRQRKRAVLEYWSKDYFGFWISDFGLKIKKYKSKTQFEYYNPHSAFTNPQLSDSSTLSQDGQERSNPLLDTP